MPYCVKFYYKTNSLIVANRDYHPIFEGIAPLGLDCNSAFRSFACPLPDCFRDYPEYLECFLYDDSKQPIFKKNNCYYEIRMNKYLERKERLEQFLLNVRSTKLSFMH